MSAAILGGSEAEWRASRSSVKWRLYPDDVLPLWVAEMDAAPCEPVVQAVEAALRRGDTGYGYGADFVDALSTYAARAWSWAIDPPRVTQVADVMIGVAEVVRLVTDVGGPVVVSSPCYNAFFDFIEMMGRRVVDAPLTDDGRLDFATLEERFARATGSGERAAYLLCNPHNPTGTVHTAAELTELAVLADRHQVSVISDEIHAPLMVEGTFTPYLTVDGGQRGVAVTSASKAWNLAGLKAAAVIAGDEAPRALAPMHEVHTHGASHLGQIAAVAAWTDGGPWLAALLDEVRVNQALLSDLLAHQLPQVSWTPPPSTYFAWLDARAMGLGDDPAATWVESARVALSSGPSFGAGGQGHARLNLATSPQIITEAIERIANATP